LTLGGGSSYLMALGDAIAEEFKQREAITATGSAMRGTDKVVVMGR
jgi:hypothetical protein